MIRASHSFFAAGLVLTLLMTFALAQTPATQPALTQPLELALQHLADPKTSFIDELHNALTNARVDEKRAVITRLHDALKSPSFEVRRRATLALHEQGDNGGVPAMIEGLQLPDEDSRGNAAVALRIIKDRRAVPALIKAVDDPSPYVRIIAMQTLGELRAGEAFGPISKRLDDRQTVSGTCIPNYPAISACLALGELGDDRAIPLLKAAVAANDPETRAAAEMAIRRIEEQRLSKGTSQPTR